MTVPDPTRKVTLTCTTCGQEFSRYKTRLRSDSGNQFCSRGCQFESQKKGGASYRVCEERSLEKHGVRRPQMSPEIKAKAWENEAFRESLFKEGNQPWNTGLKEGDNEVWDEALRKARESMPQYLLDGDPRKESWRENNRNSCLETFKNGRVSPFATMSDETKFKCQEKAAKTMKEKGLSDKGLYCSTRTGIEYHFDSGWERERMSALDQEPSVRSWSKKREPIPYVDLDGKTRRYFPDFHVEMTDGSVVIEEVKGIVTEQFLRKFDAALKFCEEKSWTYRVTFRRQPGEFVEMSREDAEKLVEGTTFDEIFGFYHSKTRKSRKKK